MGRTPLTEFCSELTGITEETLANAGQHGTWGFLGDLLAYKRYRF